MKTSEHVPSIRGLVLTYIALVALLALTYVGSMVRLGPTLVNNLFAFAIGLAKACLIVAFFMEFRRAEKLSKLWLIVGLCWLAIMSTMLTDYYTKQWDYQPRSWILGSTREDSK